MGSAASSSVARCGPGDAHGRPSGGSACGPLGEADLAKLEPRMAERVRQRGELERKYLAAEASKESVEEKLRSTDRS